MPTLLYSASTGGAIDEYHSPREDTRTKPRWFRGVIPLGLVSVATLALAGAFQVDTFYAIYTGRIVAASGPPQKEVLTSAGAHSWVDQQWLSQWVFFQADRFAGLAGVALLCTVATAVAGLLLVRLSARRGGAVPVAWAALGLTAVGFISVARTQTLVYPLFVALLSVLASTYRSDRWRPKAAAAVPILVVWANMHGSVLLGASLTVVCMLAWAIRLAHRHRLLDSLAATGVGVAAAASVLATPYGVSVLHYYSSLMGNPALRTYISDWQRGSLTSFTEYPFLLLLVLTLISLTSGLRQRRGHWKAELLVTAALTALAFYSGRYIVWAALTLPYIASTHGVPTRLKLPKQVALGGLALGSIGLLVMLIAMLSTPGSGFSSRLPLHLASIAATEAEQGRTVLADQTTSTALLWLHPATDGHVAFDIRYEQYRVADIDAYMRFLQDQNPSFACHFDAVAVSMKERPDLVRSIRENPAWTATYDDQDGIIAVQTPGATCT